MPDGAGKSSRAFIDVTPANTSPVERERDVEIERRLVADGRPLSLLVVRAVFNASTSRWKVDLFERAYWLEYVDRIGRNEAHPDHELCKAHAAWIRGLPDGVCPEIHDWGDGLIQRGTIERDRRPS